MKILWEDNGYRIGCDDLQWVSCKVRVSDGEETKGKLIESDRRYYVTLEKAILSVVESISKDKANTLRGFLDEYKQTKEEMINCIKELT